MAEYRAGNAPDRKCIIIDNDQTIQSNYQGIVKFLDRPQWTARESNMGLLEIYQFEAHRTGEPIRDLKGGACSIHLESGSCSFPPLPSPLNFASNCRCQCSCSHCPPCPPCPRPVESCLPGLHKKYRDFYPDCKESHLPSGYRNFVEHDDLYLPPSRPLSSASNYCNRPTSSRSWSPPSPSPQLKCHCGAAQVRPGPTWDMAESKPCFQTFFQASPSSTPRHPSRCDSLYLVETPQHSRSTSPVQQRRLMNTSCQCSPRIDRDTKSFQTQKSGASSPLSPHNLELSPDPSPCSRRKRPSPYRPSSPSKPIGFDPSARPLNRTPYAAELVTVEKHVQCNGSPRRESGEFDQSYTRRHGNPSLHESAASIRRVLRPESPLDLARSARRLECTCQLQPADNQVHYQNGSPSSTDFVSIVRSTLKPAVPTIDFFGSSARTNRKLQDSTTTRDTFPVDGKQQEWEISSSGRRTDRKQAEWELPPKTGSEFPLRTTDRKQWEFPSNLDWEFPSVLRATDRKQEYYSTCVRTTERGSSPIIVTPILKESVLNSARAPILTNCEAPSNNSRPLLQSGNGHYDATERSSTEANTSPPPESDEDYRYGPVQVIPKAAEPRNFRGHTSSRLPNREVIRRCCCGMCKSTYSRSHFTTKCPFCANVHSCCCGMCSCPFPSCTSKSPILDSNTSNYTSTTSSPSHDNKLLFHPGFSSSRPKSVSPMRRKYLAGLAMPENHRQRSKSSRPKCKLRQKTFEPSPRALLESFHNYLKSESRRAKASSSPHWRCSERRSTHWNPPSGFPDRSCSQRAKRLSAGKAPRGQQQQAPWGTHPILLSSRPPNGQALEYRLPYRGSYRDCCCSRCVNGKL